MYQLIHFQLLDIVHPAAKTLVDIAKSQDAEVGDGTTSVVMLAGNLATIWLFFNYNLIAKEIFVHI